MLKCKMYLIGIVSMCLLVGCVNNNIEQNNSETQDSVTHAEYSGYWSYEGKTHDQILAEGGIELSCTVTEDDQFSGTLFSQQEITERFASIEDISGSFELIRQKEETSVNDITDNSSYDPSWTEEEIIRALNERGQYYESSAYYSEIIDYWENVRGVRDISNVLEPLFETDKRYYTKEEFESEPMLVIHLAKNEIYARHGYIFTNEDLYNYFMGCIWYNPTCYGTNFDDSIFNEYEKANLEILADLDTY